MSALSEIKLQQKKIAALTEQLERELYELRKYKKLKKNQTLELDLRE